MEEMRNGERLKMRHWLQNAIDSGEFDGVEWIDKVAGKFRVPWKHASRHGWDIDRDACIFKRWAIYTGKYPSEQKQMSEKKKRSLAKLWKANFRCALNALQDIEVVRAEGKSRGRDAYKVFRLLPQKKPKSKVTKIRPNSTSSIDNKEDTKIHLRRTPSLPLKGPYQDPGETYSPDVIIKQEEGVGPFFSGSNYLNHFPLINPPNGIDEVQNGTAFQQYQLQQYDLARMAEVSDGSDGQDSDSVGSSHSSDIDIDIAADASERLIELLISPGLRQIQENARNENNEHSVVTEPINHYNAEFFRGEDLMLSGYNSRSQSLRNDQFSGIDVCDQYNWLSFMK